MWAGAILLALRKTPAPGLGFLPKNFQPQYFFFPGLLLWMFVVPYMLAHGAVGRCNRLALTMPLSARSLWLARVLGLTLSGLGVLGMAAATVICGEYLQGEASMDPGLRSLLISVAGCVVLTVMLLQNPRPNLYELPMNTKNILYIIAVGIGTLLLVSWLSTQPTAYALVATGLGVMLGVRIYRSLPATFDLVPHRPDRGTLRATHPSRRGHDASTDALSESLWTGSEKPSRWTVHRTVLRTLYNPWLTTIMLGLIVVFGWRNAGNYWSGLSNLVWYFWVIVMLSGLFVAAIVKVPMLDPLPISRRLIFAYLVLPGLSVAFMGYGLGAITGKGMFGNQPLVEYRAMRYDSQMDVRVPLGFWEIAWDGVPQPLEECCDQPYAAWSVSLLRGTDIVLYNPYHAPADSSPGFVARQFGRAIEDVYSKQIPSAELGERYFGMRSDGGTEVKDDPLNLLVVYPDLRARESDHWLPGIILAVGLIWLLYLAGNLSRKPGSVLIGHFALIGLTTVLLVALIWTTNAGYTSEWKISAFAAILARKLVKWLPGNALTAWGIVTAVIVCGYFLAESRFRQFELPAQPKSPLGLDSK
jgi:hypothetical protein